MTELEKLEAGEPYDFLDCEVAARKDLAIRKCAEYNAIDPLDSKARWSYLHDWFGSFGESSWGGHPPSAATAGRTSSWGRT